MKVLIFYSIKRENITISETDIKGIIGKILLRYIITKNSKMSYYYPDIHYRRSIRLKDTIIHRQNCILFTFKTRICRFGKTERVGIVLNELGQITYDHPKFSNFLLWRSKLIFTCNGKKNP
jgi:hypothetical protein